MVKDRTHGCLSRLAGRQPIVRVLMAAGVGSRVLCSRWIREGRVTIHGRVVRDAGARADPFRDRIALDGESLRLDHACRYLLLNKPYGVLCAFTDADHGRGGGERRPTLADLVDVPGVYAAGRLDLDSEGLLLLTDDGWLIHRLTHPRYCHPKTYLAQVEQVPDRAALAALRRGVVVRGRRTAPAQVELLPEEPPLPPRSVPVRHREHVPTAWMRLVLTEGRKRQVRHMTAAVGHPTLRLVRVGIGPLVLGELSPGEWRDLAPGEFDALGMMLGTAASR